MKRRDFIKAAGAVALGAGAVSLANAEEPVTIGLGQWTYTLDPTWGKLPAGYKYGWGVGIVADSKDNIYIHSRDPRAVIVFDRDGKLVNDFGAEFAGTAHGLYWHKEGRDEFLYYTDHPRNMVVKTDLRGNVVMRIGKVDAGKNNVVFDRFNQPTDLAIAPNGDIYVCEGYGGNVIHRFTRDGVYKQTIGKKGTAPGEFDTPHGIWVDVRKKEPELYVADRKNHRLQVFHLDGTLKRIVAVGDVRLPCCFYTRRNEMFIPDLESRVTILDKNDKVVAQLGDGKTVKSAATFQAPHALCLDSKGSLYVIEWLDYSRPRKFVHTPQRG